MIDWIKYIKTKQTVTLFDHNNTMLAVHQYLTQHIKNKYMKNKNVQNSPCAASFINSSDNKVYSFLIGHVNGAISFWNIQNGYQLKMLDISKKIHKGEIIGLIPLNREMVQK